MNTFQLTCFLAVAEHLNFARAAEQLHVTHPAVSQQIQSLEKELNTKLFIRTTRTVKLTEEGKAFLNDAQQMVAISERAKKRFENQHLSQHPKIRRKSCDEQVIPRTGCWICNSNATKNGTSLDMHARIGCEGNGKKRREKRRAASGSITSPGRRPLRLLSGCQTTLPAR